MEPIYLKIGPNWQCFLNGSSKMAPNNFIFFSIVKDAEYLSHVKSIATYALISFLYIISALASMPQTIPQDIFKTFKNRYECLLKSETE